MSNLEVLPEITRAFNSAFPEHKGHKLDAPSVRRDMTKPIVSVTCSCGTQMQLTEEQMALHTTWKHIGGDLEARKIDHYVDIRVRGSSTQIFISKAALEKALALFT